MKFTTFQQKIVFSAKVFACVLILGILSFLSFMPEQKISTTANASSSTTLSVTIIDAQPAINAVAPNEVGQNVPISGSSSSVDHVDVYLDKNKDGIIDSDDVLLAGTVIVNSDGTLTGSVNLPDGLDHGEYQLIVRGHTGSTPEYVYDIVIVDYVGDSPVIDCVHNKNNDCTPLPGGDKPAFGGVEGGTEIIIDGGNFGDDTNTIVIIGDQECKITSITSDKITCVVPPAKDGQPGPVDVTVCVNGKCTSIVDGFLYYGALPETPDTGGDLGTPGTGLFRFGSTVVTTKDIVWWIGVLIILTVAIAMSLIVKSPKKTTHYSAGGVSNKKRSYRNQKVSYSSTKKNVKSKTKKN